MKYKLLYFSTEWCTPCKVFKPVFEETVKEKSELFDYEFVDAEENYKLSNEYKIRSVPTIIVLKENNVVDTISGAMYKKSLEEKLDKYK